MYLDLCISRVSFVDLLRRCSRSMRHTHDHSSASCLWQLFQKLGVPWIYRNTSLRGMLISTRLNSSHNSLSMFFSFFDTCIRNGRGKLVWIVSLLGNWKSIFCHCTFSHCFLQLVVRVYVSLCVFAQVLRLRFWLHFARDDVELPQLSAFHQPKEFSELRHSLLL